MIFDLGNMVLLIGESVIMICSVLGKIWIFVLFDIGICIEYFVIFGNI